MTFVLARRVTGGARLESWLAGLAFAWAPLLVARSTGHFSLVAAAPLAAFLWCLHRVERSERLRDSALAGLVVAWAAFCDAYYAVYCLLIAALYVGSRAAARWNGGPTGATGVGRWILDLCILLAGGLVAGLALGRGGRLDFFGVPVSVRGLYTPMFLLTVLVVARVLARAAARTCRASRCPIPGASARRSPPGSPAPVVLSPALYGASAAPAGRQLGIAADSAGAAVRRGVDLLAFFQPNPSHPLVVWLAGSAQLAAPTVFVEYTASLGLVAHGRRPWSVCDSACAPRGW